MNTPHCWHCVHHQRQLFETEFGRPLFYHSICAAGEKISDVICDSFFHALMESFEGLAMSDPSTVVSLGRE